PPEEVPKGVVATSSATARPIASPTGALPTGRVNCVRVCARVSPSFVVTAWAEATPDPGTDSRRAKAATPRVILIDDLGIRRDSLHRLDAKSSATCPQNDDFAKESWPDGRR